jgi:RNA polymerase sigma factor (TIGR02999 family)
MRRVLVDYARGRDAQKRGGGAVKVALDEIQAGINPKKTDLVALDEALGVLERVDPRAAQVVELRFFGGYTDQEVSEVVGVSLATVRRDWEFARTWLFDRMHGQPAAHI